MGAYDWCFYPFEKEQSPAGSLYAPEQARFRGELSIPGAFLNIPYRACCRTGYLEREPHFHRDEEYLAFVGHDLRDAFDSFDAEIVFYMGERLDDMEKIVIDRPAMIKVPGLYWHGPLEITRLGKPLFFQPVLFNSRYYAIHRRFDRAGNPYMETICQGLSPCKLEKDKTCSFCGKCREGKEG